MAPALTPIALERAEAPGTLWIALPTSLHILVPLAWGLGTRLYNQRAVSGRLAQAGLTILSIYNSINKVQK